MRHFIDTQDFTSTELRSLLELTGLLKAADRQGGLPPLLAGASLGMIFEEPSTRTRISFEVAMTRLGGHALYLKPGEIHLGVRESIKDTARVMSRMVDAIEARTLKHATVTELARWATVPVINGLTDYNHPTQVLCDVFTMIEHSPDGKRLEDLRVAFIGDATNVCSSLMMICTRLGLNFTHCAPARYQAPEAWQAIARANCAASGGSFTVTEDPLAAVAGADFVYTDLWWWVGQEAEIPERTAAFMPRYQINEALLAHAPAHAKFMHCLPASRGVEVTDAVMDGPRSIIYDQSENRLHAEKAILAAFVAPRLKPRSAARSHWHAGRIAEFLKHHPLTEPASPALLSEVDRHV
ncbi:MAG: putrescine carbamoyltransferase [Alphaproteobacteria bacterium]|uniref:putrescine carbamoyltransferase n=1 Tax=Brevundimonas sp. TaxID=1871086 RepID=UPI000DB7D035|nr:putrescine carbamoyltransferase [Brevundimonas sp.]MBJ7317633.1 putrescine carbamoyltransferase [Brevundimonas sp.]PZO07780.1 MAG: putrescine carbamoyltransferase [Alphaproteobacteria bacterium]